MNLPYQVQQRIVEFLQSLPNMQESKQQHALIASAGLDARLLDQLDFSGTSAQFVRKLIETLLKYGALEDGRHALDAVLNAAKEFVGVDRQAYCDRLIQEFHAFQAGNVAQARNPEPEPARIDPHWHLKIDRVKQYNSVIAQTRLMLREQKPKTLVFVWYGQEGQGIEIFHERLLVELREELSQNTHVHQVRPRWPEHLENYHTAFGDVLSEAFGVKNLDDISARVRAESHGVSGKQTLIYVRHEPVRSAQLINPESLKGYVRWWDAEFTRLFEPKQFALLGVSFLVKNPPAFAEYIEEQAIDEDDLRRTVFWLLDEMEEVAKKDLLLFLRTHNIDLPPDRKDDILQKILNNTGGRYEQTIDELKQLRQDVWRVGGPVGRKPIGPKRFDY